MSNIKFSLQVNTLLDKNLNLKTAIQHYANTLAAILEKNDLPFFPYYTDHGIAHIEAVLQSASDLIPEEAWQVLTAEDAAVLIGATLLHDIAMLVQADGFLELIDENSRFQPVGWIKEELPWYELWQQYEREAKRFSDKKLAEIIGEQATQNWKFDGLPKDKSFWTENHKLIIGEFIRRHHTRLAHEIALNGFLGLDENSFPVLANDKGLGNLADLIGLTARSHGVSLRLCQDYLKQKYSKTLKPRGVAVLYPMALLRVADYLQMKCDRAPLVLLQLSKPTSPISRQEWAKHRAVISITEHDDPMGRMIEIDDKLSLETYLQLQELIAGLQREIDHATVVLSEVYGSRDNNLNKLTLKLRRVYSSLDDEPFRERLPYIPERTGFSVDPNLLSLLVKPLYGDVPNVGIRELMQNGMDAVRELETWCELHHKDLTTLDLPNLAENADVLIDYILDEHGSWLVRIQDRGIGMAHSTLQNYFLRAGASFRQSKEWQNDYVDDDGKTKVLKAGRFGIGAFAVFLLGQSFTLKTRHVNSDKNGGFTFTASANSQLIEIKRCPKLDIGTMIEVHLNDGAVERLKLNKETYQSPDSFAELVDWAAWQHPKVIQRVHSHNSNPVILSQRINAPIPNIQKAKPDNEWFKQNPKYSVIYPKGFDAVFWTFGLGLSCNGISIQPPNGRFPFLNRNFSEQTWAKYIGLNPPALAVVDSEANLPLTMQRYDLTDDSLPFVEELKHDIGLSIIANFLVCVPETWQALYQSNELQKYHPLVSDYGHKNLYQGSNEFIDKYFSFGLLRWCYSDDVVIPADPWFYSLLNKDKCFIYGCILPSGWMTNKLSRDSFKKEQLTEISIAEWNMVFSGSFPQNVNPKKATMFNELVESGVVALGDKIKGCSVHFSSRHFNPNEYEPSQANWILEGKKPNKSSSGLLSRFKSVDENANKPSIQRKHFSKTTGDIKPVLDLPDLLKRISAQMVEAETKDNRANFSEDDYIFYVAEIHTEPSQCEPESFLAKLWYDILGANPIPCDAEKRQALIEKGRAHPELKRHIEAWEMMKALDRKN